MKCNSTLRRLYVNLLKMVFVKRKSQKGSCLMLWGVSQQCKYALCLFVLFINLLLLYGYRSVKLGKNARHLGFSSHGRWDGNNLTLSSSCCGALSDRHQTTTALYPFPPPHHSMKDLLGELQRVGIRAVWGSCVFAQEIIKQMLRDAVRTHDLVRGVPPRPSLPLAPPQRQLSI